VSATRGHSTQPLRTMRTPKRRLLPEGAADLEDLLKRRRHHGRYPPRVCVWTVVMLDATCFVLRTPTRSIATNVRVSLKETRPPSRKPHHSNACVQRGSSLGSAQSQDEGDPDGMDGQTGWTAADQDAIKPHRTMAYHEDPLVVLQLCMRADVPAWCACFVCFSTFGEMRACTSQKLKLEIEDKLIKLSRGVIEVRVPNVHTAPAALVVLSPRSYRLISAKALSNPHKPYQVREEKNTLLRQVDNLMLEYKDILHLRGDMAQEEKHKEVCARGCMYGCMHVHAVYVFMHVHTHMHARMHVHFACAFVCVRAFARSHVHTHSLIHSLTRTHTSVGGRTMGEII
jgi:hypothetical protein